MDFDIIFKCNQFHEKESGEDQEVKRKSCPAKKYVSRRFINGCLHENECDRQIIVKIFLSI